MSKSFSQILQIDPMRREIVNVYQFSGIPNPQGIVFKGDTLQILGYENGKNMLYSLTE